MKRIVLTMGIALVATMGMAQKGNVTNAAMAYKDFQSNAASGDLEQATKDVLEAKKYIDLACNHPDTKDTPKALMYKGKIYIEMSAMVAGTEDKSVFEGIDPEKTVEEGFDALVKSKEVDTKGRYTDDVDQYAQLYRAQFSNMGITAYGEEKWEMAMGGLLGAAQFGEVIGIQDSMFFFFGGISAYNQKEWKTAAEALGTCVELGYNTSEAVSYQSKALIELGQNEEAEKALSGAVEKYPNDVDVLIQQINFYIDADRKEEAEKALSAAIALTPDNVALVYTSGNIYEQMGRLDDAEAAYRKALDLDPNNVNAKFSLGGLFFNKGADMNNEANKLPFGDPNYDNLVAESKEMFKKALPFLEEAAAAEPNDVVILESLKAVYGKLSMTDKFKETKAKIDALKNQ